MKITRRKLRSLIESVIRESAQDAVGSGTLSDADQKSIISFLEGEIDDYVEGKYPDVTKLGNANPMTAVNVEKTDVSDARVRGYEYTGRSDFRFNQTLYEPSNATPGQRMSGAFTKVGQELLLNVSIRIFPGVEKVFGKGTPLGFLSVFAEEISEFIDSLSLKVAGGSVAFDSIQTNTADLEGSRLKDLKELRLLVAVRYFKK